MMAFSDPHTEGDPRSTANGETHWAGHFRAGHLSASKDPNLFLNPNLGRKGNPMTLFNQLKSRAESGNPIRVGLIGAGKFGSMFLSKLRARLAFIFWALRICRYPEPISLLNVLAGAPNDTVPLHLLKRSERVRLMYRTTLRP